jgi:hypothetical protein
MPSTQLIKTNSQLFKKVLMNNNVLIITTLLFILYTFLMQAFSALLATFLGALCAFFFIKFQIKKEEQLKNTHSLCQLKYILGLSIKCNENFTLHRQTVNDKHSHPWEHLINFYEFNTLPSIDFKNLSFLQNHDEGNIFFEELIQWDTQLNSVGKALCDLQKLHHMYLEKLNLWESRIKTMKGIKEMQKTELKLVREKIGASLINELLFLTDLIIKSSSMIDKNGNQIINKLSHSLL